MKLTALNASWFGFIALACVGIGASHATETTKANIVYIVADDQRGRTVTTH